MFENLRKPWHWQELLFSFGRKRKASCPRLSGWRMVRVEPLEDRCLLSFDPTALSQELLFHTNRMRVDPQGELDVLFSSIDPLTARDPSSQAAIEYFQDPTTAEILSEWASLTPTAPLSWNESLYNAAMGHSQLMQQYDVQTHQITEAGEPRPAARAEAAGYTTWTRVGENIFAYAETPFHAHSAFVIDWGPTNEDRGHRTNIMNPDYREVGIGIITDNSSSTNVGPLVVTQDFGNRWDVGGPFLVGVVYADGDSDASYDASEGLGGITITATGTGGTFTTTTMTAGGWQLQLPAGEYTVTASGGGFTGTGRVSVDVGTSNVEVDFLSGLNTGYVNFDLWEINAESLGPIDLLALAGVDPSAGSRWYQFQPKHSGLLTVDAAYDAADGAAQVVLYDSAGGELDRSETGGGYERADATVVAGQTYLMEVGGSSPNVDLRLVNLVERNGTSVIVHGTAEDDAFVFDAAADRTVSIVELSYEFGGLAAMTFSFDGLGGADTVTFIGSAQGDTATIRPNQAEFTGPGYSVSVTNIAATNYDGGGGADTVTVWGSPGENIYHAHPGWSEMTGDGVSISVEAEKIYARGSGGGDTVWFHDSQGNDLLEYFSIWARMSGAGYFHHVRGFQTMRADTALGQDGTDRVVVRGSKLNDYLRVNPYNDDGTSIARFLSGAGSIWHIATGFEEIVGYGLGGALADQFFLNDTPGADTFELERLHATLDAPDYGVAVSTHGFGTVEARRIYLNSSADRVNLGDSQWAEHDDTLVGDPKQVTMSGPGYSNSAVEFPLVMAYSSGKGHDTAHFSDLTDPEDRRTGVDTFTAYPLYAQLEGNGYRLYARLFDEVHAESKYGRDTALLTGSAGVDELLGAAAEVSLSGTNIAGLPYANHARSFHEVRADAVGEQDRAVLTDAIVDLQTYQQPNLPLLNDMAQALWLSRFEKIELHDSGTGATTPVDNVDAVFAYWQ